MQDSFLFLIPSLITAILGGGVGSHLYKKLAQSNIIETTAPYFEKKVDKEIYTINITNLQNDVAEIKSDVKDLIKMHLK
jgi:hypothetical protein